MKANSDPHAAAVKGDMAILNYIANTNPSLLHSQDENGWHPIHEAARAGHTDAVRFLIEQGANVNERTNKGEGMSPLRIAIDFKGNYHSVTKLLRDSGGVDYNHGDEF